jgi:ABC-2 type transport system permease protein
MIKRADFFGNILVNLIQIFATVVLWLAIYNPDLKINGYSLQDTITYYVLILLVTYATTTDTSDYVSKSIKSGTLSEWLLKPRSILLSEISRSFGNQFYRLLVLIPIYLGIGLLVNISNIGVNFSIINILLGGIFVLFGFLLNCLLEYTLAMFSFWMDEVWSIKHFKEVTTDLLGGKRIPLAFFPAVVLSVNKLLPFQFIYFVPVEYLLGKRHLNTNTIQDLFSICIWVVIFLIASSFLYRKGVKKYGAFGN